MSVLRWKGELGDGHVHMTAREYVDHKSKEDSERHRQVLRKIANNPILTADVQAAVRYAIYRIDDNEMLRKRCSDLMETIENMKKARKTT